MNDVAAPVMMQGITADDLADVYSITKSSGFFSEDEVMMADEVARDSVLKGEIVSGYSYIFALINGTKVGYSCFGPIPCTDERYRIYWLAVDDRLRGRGLGSQLLQETEKTIAARGGKRIYLETSTRDQYKPTRDFYRKCGYIAEAKLENYFYDGDGMVMYVKIL